ncbi:hypothetical protein AB1Y20_010528 [Prymnesium parvum]|uniref:Uncharacterized protein n=1 Tax=Prymnesium parvum TaxID=97485 RepID=A0AB34IS67_PRYPA
MAELRTLWRLLHAYDIALHPVYIRSAANRIADAASRMAAHRDYTLARPHFERLQRRWGWCTVDAFASPATAQLPRYWVPAHHTLDYGGAEAVDAFAQAWDDEFLWVHPPPSLVPHVLQMLQRSRCLAMVCIPAWRTAPWLGTLAAISTDSLASGGVPGKHPPHHVLRLRRADGTAFEHLRPVVSRWKGGETAVRLAATALESSTARSYGRHWLAFCEWCAAHDLDPMPATQRMVFAYIGFLAEKGTVAADSLQPYLSAINSAHADCGYDRPALGHLIARARQGMRRAQALAATRDTRVPLPAEAVLRVLRHACASARAWRRDLSAAACAHLLRGAYAVCLSFLFFGRQDSCVALRTHDHGIQPDAIWLRLTRPWSW